MNREQHALLGGSNAARWLACTPSARLEEKILAETGDDRETSFSSEGTVAHSLAESKLLKFLGEDDGGRMDEVQNSQFYNADMDANIQIYTDYVQTKFAEALNKDPEAILRLEQSLDFSNFVPQGFGRGDAVIIADGVMEIIDLKYGRFTPVVAKDNPQLRLYALGALNDYDWFYNIRTVIMTIVQPRNQGVTSDILLTDSLKEWGNTVVKPRAILAYDGAGETKAGTHCRFCLAAPRCRALHDKCMAAKAIIGKEPQLLSEDELKVCLESGEMLASYLNSVRQYVLDRALQTGKTLDGYKVVASRTSASYGDTNAVIERLEKAGYQKKDFMKPSDLIGVTAMKKLLSTRKFHELLDDLLVKPEGRPTLAPVDDKRPAYDPAEGFTDLDKETGK